MKTPITMQNIADRAGVSRRTVSDVLNNKKSFVSEATRLRVRTVADEMGYRPNYFAKSLKQGKTRCIGLLGGPMIVDFRFPYIADTASSIELQMAEIRSPYSLLIFGASYHEGNGKNIELLQKGLVDGVLLLMLTIDIKYISGTLVPVLNQLRIPFVAVHTLAQEFPFNNVGVDMGQGMYDGTMHLIEKGYRDIRYYTRVLSTELDRESLAGFNRAMAAAGLPADESRLMFSPGRRVLNLYTDGYRAAQEMEDVPEAIVCSSDEQAVGLIRGFRDRGLRVPGDVAVLAQDGSLPNKFFSRELTAVRHPVREKCDYALELLHGIMAGNRDGNGIHRHVFVPDIHIGTTT